MQILILIVAAWYLGRALVGAGQHANVQQAGLSLCLGLVWLPFLHFLPTSFTLDYLLFGGIAVLGIVYDIRYRRTWPELEDDLESILPRGRLEWACAVAMGLCFLLGLLLLAGPLVFPAGSGASAQSIHELAQLGKRHFDNELGIGLTPLVAGIYHLGGLYGARLLMGFWGVVIVLAVVLLGYRVGGRRGAWAAGALCSAGPWISSLGLAFPEHAWHVLALLVFTIALLPEGDVAPTPRLVAVSAAPLALAATDSASAPLVLAGLLLAPAPFLRPESGYNGWVKAGLVLGASMLVLVLAILYYGVRVPLFEGLLILWSQVMRPESSGAWLVNPGAAALALGIPALFLGGHRLAMIAAAGLSAALLGAWLNASAGMQLAPLVLLVAAGGAWIGRGGRGIRVAYMLAGVMIVAGLAFHSSHVWDRLAVLTGREAPAAYLERHVPRYGVIAHCNTHHPDEAVALFETSGAYLGAYGFVVREAMILDATWPANLLERDPLQRPRLIALPSREALAGALGYGAEAVERLEVLRRGEESGFRLLQRFDLPKQDGGIERVWLFRVPETPAASLP